jgi:hypothetical protein
MRLYLAGKMRGEPNFGFPLFHAAADRLREQGHEVFNPAEKVNERLNVDVSADNPTGDESIAASNHGYSLRDALFEDVEYICKHAEGIAMLPNWQSSKGAIAERALAIALGLEIIYLKTDTYEIIKS